jgi:hypothetical protein
MKTGAESCSKILYIISTLAKMECVLNNYIVMTQPVSYIFRDLLNLLFYYEIMYSIRFTCYHCLHSALLSKSGVREASVEVPG